ncbi:hypothetical protein DL240_01145 [Lujinxingia litoralis]|uniref:Uncharacterized protein n=1 Tax=Lujinxingia litoralis TaxID=2211119 RepID=A0A328CAX9_9DELT|nr:hypothetical protein [Lujinxingia litoralis]RAL24846.1 hypothetical protein DL240_01145 [Lujinxingia litoralis]
MQKSAGSTERAESGGEEGLTGAVLTQRVEVATLQVDRACSTHRVNEDDMMKRALVGLVLAASMAWSGQAFAQNADGDELRSKFYNFEEMLVEGGFRSPDLVMTEAHHRVQFPHLRNLKTGFLPKIRESRADETLQ